MKSVLIALMCCLTALGCTWLIGQQKWTTAPPIVVSAPAPHPPAELKDPNVYEFHAAESQIFLIDQRDGYIWRYFRNHDDQGKINAEGFTQLGFVPLPERPPKWGANDPVVSPTATAKPKK